MKFSSQNHARKSLQILLQKIWDSRFRFRFRFSKSGPPKRRIRNPESGIFYGAFFFFPLFRFSEKCSLIAHFCFSRFQKSILLLTFSWEWFSQLDFRFLIFTTGSLDVGNPSEFEPCLQKTTRGQLGFKIKPCFALVLSNLKTDCKQVYHRGSTEFQHCSLSSLC